MTSSKKKRMSMLDSLANAGAASAVTSDSMMPGNRALKAAREAVDSHHVWELNPDLIRHDRPNDRLDPNDVGDLQLSIEASGQAVPILVRRDPDYEGCYQLIYGRRRLEAIRKSHKVDKIRALVTNMSTEDALQAQVAENTARRDLSYIEKAMFAKELIDGGYGNQSKVAEVLSVTKSSISMALAIVDVLTPLLIRCIGPAHGIGRPRWDALCRAIEETGADTERLAKIAEDVHVKVQVDAIKKQGPYVEDVSLLALETVEKTVGQTAARPAKTSKTPRSKRRVLNIGANLNGSVKRTPKGISIEVEDSAFATWVEREAEDLLQQLHTRWLQRGEG